MIISPQVFAETKESMPSINETQFQLKINQTASIESSNIKVKFLNVTGDSRCPSDVTCVWEGQIKIFVHIIKNNHDLGDFNLTSRGGQKNLALQSFDGYLIQILKVEPYPTSGKRILPSDYVSTFVISKTSVLSPLKQFKLGIVLKNINCNNNFQLVIKAKDGTPACVKPETATKLIELGWAKVNVMPIQ